MQGVQRYSTMAKLQRKAHAFATVHDDRGIILLSCFLRAQVLHVNPPITKQRRDHPRIKFNSSGGKE